MKVATQEELEAHNEAIIYGGIKGLLLGGCISACIFTFGARRFPRIRTLGTSFKTALVIGPPTFGASLVGEIASIDFDRKLYSNDSRVAERHLKEIQRWKSMSLKDKVVESLSAHKYKIIVGAWAASMYGSWVLVDRDPIMTQTQKIVQARVYAQFLTVILLLGSVGLSVYEEKLEKQGKLKKHNKNVDDSWKDIMEDEEKAELARESAKQV